MFGSQRSSDFSEDMEELRGWILNLDLLSYIWRTREMLKMQYEDWTG
jgi:hypothetical protein